MSVRTRRPVGAPARPAASAPAPDQRQHDGDLQQPDQQPAGGAVAVLQQVAQAGGGTAAAAPGTRTATAGHRRTTRSVGPSSVLTPCAGRATPRVQRVLAQGARSRSRAPSGPDQRLQHRRRPGVAAATRCPGAPPARRRRGCRAARGPAAAVVGVLVAGQLVAQEPGRRPAHMGPAARRGGRQQARRCLAPGGAEERRHGWPVMASKRRAGRSSSAQYSAASAAPARPACGPCDGRSRAAPFAGRPARRRGPRCASRRRGPRRLARATRVPIASSRLCRPVLRALVGQEEGGLDAAGAQHLGHQRRHAHVAGVEGQVHRLVAGRGPAAKSNSTSATRRTATASAVPAGSERGAWSSVHTPCGDLPTSTWRTTLRRLDVDEAQLARPARADQQRAAVGQHFHAVRTAGAGQYSATTVMACRCRSG
jgi:hypothetical protein